MYETQTPHFSLDYADAYMGKYTSSERRVFTYENQTSASSVLLSFESAVTNTLSQYV